MRLRLRRVTGLVFSLLLVASSTSPAFGWTTEAVLQMAGYSLRVVPPDMLGQVEKHRKQLDAGIRAAAESDPRNSGEAGVSVKVSPIPIVQTEVDRAIAKIVEHRPFREIVFQFGVVSYWVAALNDPLPPVEPGRAVPPYWHDYRNYLEDAHSRFSVLYYPFDRQVESAAQLEAMLRRAQARRIAFGPMIDAEYRRIGGAEGLLYFDDKSSAFGVGSLAFSHGVSDIAGTLRYIWLRAGGRDSLHLPSLDPDHLILISSGPDDR